MSERRMGYIKDGGLWKRPAVDTKCYQLAADFLSDVEASTIDDVWELAADLQRTVEDACREVEERAPRG
jgi:hypothetical protein